MNHFELLGLPFQFDVDGSLLSLKYRELQRHFHPDNFATSSERDRLLAVQKAAQINDAFQILKDPVLRAEYILAEKGEDIRGEQVTMQDPMFLMQQMELRESLEDIPSTENPDEALAKFGQEVKGIYQTYLDELRQLLDEKAWSNATIVVRKLKFIVKLQVEIDNMEERLLDLW
ncbi:co-chaperone HscB [Vibrio sp. SS-MA-C1-2]|uniref:co-chaperone HscB n=1 Tax=Vibrio sp. SS-MA-C1-2 TaxID=2908646 RepID=UPI001F27B86E|nr:co-chaperone HscB [Vibrio sp. SS-MA-C1-2]UJF18967.1 co-chaperone HscB [Vibrio sp. SS-MA-C1-2]